MKLLFLFAALLGAELVFSKRAWAEALPAPALLSKETYSETYSLTAYGDGVVVQLQLGITNLGWGSGRAICRLYAKRADAHVREHAMYPRAKWGTFGNPVTALTAPGCRIRAGKTTEFAAALEGAAVEVRTAQPLRPIATPQTAVNSGDGSYRSQVLLAASPAVITWTQAGKKAVFNGRAHIDHSRSTLLPSKIAAGWLRFRALEGEGYLLSARLPPGDSIFNGWLLQGGQLLALQAPRPDWWPTSAAKQHIETPHGVLTLGEPIEIFEPLNDLGIFKRAAELLVGHPRTVLYWAELAGVRGLLEVATQD